MPTTPIEGSLSSNPANASIGSPSPLALTHHSRTDFLERWVQLAHLQKLLDQGLTSLIPLKDTISELTERLVICEDEMSGKREYEALKAELETTFELLSKHYAGEVPPTITASVETLCRDIRRELQGVSGKLHQDQSRGSKEGSENLGDVLKSYTRVRDLLQRISLNADTSMWKIANASATDNRLDRLRPSMSACYNSAQATELKRGPCSEDTRVDMLSKMHGWIAPSNPGSVYWMAGMAGNSKTAIAYSLCQDIDTSGKLPASFFCSRLSPKCKDFNQIIPSIAYQLAQYSLPFRAALSDVLEKEPDQHTHLSHLQFDALIVQPLQRVKDTLPDDLVIVIDALDECENKDSTSRIVNVLLAKVGDVPVKFVVSSPPEPELWDRMSEQSDQDRLQVVLHELDSHTVVLEFTLANP